MSIIGGVLQVCMDGIPTDRARTTSSTDARPWELEGMTLTRRRPTGRCGERLSVCRLTGMTEVSLSLFFQLQTE